jgi:hypothetical protein
MAGDIQKWWAPELASIVASCVVASACTGSTQEPPSIARPEPPTKPANETARQPSYDAQRLVAAVTAVARAPLDPSYRTESAALEALAACIEGFSAADIAAARVRAAAEQLATHQTTEVARVKAVSDALAAAGGVLTVRGLGNRPDDEEDDTWTLAYEAAIGRLDSSTSLLEQRGRLLGALRAATNLVYAAQSAGPPFPPDQVLREWEKPATFCDAVEQTRARVRALATVASQDARVSAADALFAMADVMALDTKTAKHQDQLAEIRLEAFALRHRKSFQAAQGIKVALSRTMDVLASAWTEPELESWIRMARRTIDGIEEGPVVFEHAAVQDAVRTVLNVIVRRANMTNACATGGGASSPDVPG